MELTKAEVAVLAEAIGGAVSARSVQIRGIRIPGFHNLVLDRFHVESMKIDEFSSSFLRVYIRVAQELRRVLCAVVVKRRLKLKDFPASEELFPYAGEFGHEAFAEEATAYGLPVLPQPGPPLFEQYCNGSGTPTLASVDAIGRIEILKAICKLTRFIEAIGMRLSGSYNGAGVEFVEHEPDDETFTAVLDEKVTGSIDYINARAAHISSEKNRNRPRKVRCKKSS
jgi:hypothetical protein